jgi:metal-dependent amidase/aminoacylase/carboxypeptidase family protein
VHPILTNGGTQVNVIPGEARLEMYVRGKTAEGILDASRKVDRALRAGALALGATVEIETVPGPLPLLNDPTMEGLFEKTAPALVGAEHVKRVGHSGGCTDMGDVSHLMPVLHPYMGGARGTGHGADYAIVDPMLAYVAPAKALASMAVDLLTDGGAGAREVLRRSRPRMTREDYLAFQRGLEERRTYAEGEKTT